MTRKEPRESVVVGYDLDYDSACERFGDPGHLARWQELGNAMAHRSGWHFDIVNDDEPLWSFGAFGSSVLAIYVEADGRYACFDYFSDHTDFPGDLPAVVRWVDVHEAEAMAQHTGSYELLAHDDWALLARHTLDLDVTWFDGYFSGSVRTIPGTAAFQPDLRSTVLAAAEMVTDHIGAPRDKASTVSFRVHLDQAAATALRT